MNKDDLIHILCRLTHSFYDFPTEDSKSVYVFSKRKYKISFRRIEGQFESLTIEDSGEILNEV